MLLYRVLENVEVYTQHALYTLKLNNSKAPFLQV